MVRGYQKKVVFLKNTGSEIYDEAYFVLSDRGAKEKTEGDLIAEATRIIEENMDVDSIGRGRLTRLLRFLGRRVIPFFIGAALAVGVCLLVFLT